MRIDVAFCFSAVILANQFINVNIEDATFRIGSSDGPVFKSLGASLYPYWAGTLEDYSRRMMTVLLDYDICVIYRSITHKATIL